jgi:HlyD family secretion protein
MLEANQPLAEAETLIAQRKSDRVFAKTKLERGQQLVEKAALTTQVFDQRVAKAETMGAAVRAAKAEHEQAQFDDQDRLGRGGRIELILADLKLVAPRGSRVQYKIF